MGVHDDSGKKFGPLWVVTLVTVWGEIIDMYMSPW